MRYILLIWFSLLVGLASAQRPNFPGSSSSNRTNTPPTSQDTSSNNSGGASGFKRVFSGKPGKAAGYSLMVPGWGQAYNGKPWKIPLVYALEGTAVYFLIRNIRKYRQFDTCYTELVGNNNLEAPECRGITDVGDIFLIRRSYRKNRELSYVYLAGAHLFQAFEAFIDRHLVDFDLDEDLSFTPFIQPDFNRTDIPLGGLYINLSPQKKKLILNSL